jgi:hypothetical protein
MEVDEDGRLITRITPASTPHFYKGRCRMEVLSQKSLHKEKCYVIQTHV